MGIEQTMSIEDNYVKSYHDLWVTDSWLKLFPPFGFKSMHYGRLGVVGILDHCNLISTNWLIKILPDFQHKYLSI